MGKKHESYISSLSELNKKKEELDEQNLQLEADKAELERKRKLFESSKKSAEKRIRQEIEDEYDDKINDLEDEKLVFSNARGMNGIKEVELDVGDIKIKAAIANGMKNAKTLIDKIKEGNADYQFVEVMNCVGGCVAGGGQPKLSLLEMKDKKLERMNGLYSEDEKMKRRLSYKNPDIIRIYKEFYNDKERVHKYLHTSYRDKSYLLRGEQ